MVIEDLERRVIPDNDSDRFSGNNASSPFA